METASRYEPSCQQTSFPCPHESPIMSKRYGRNIRWHKGAFQTYVMSGGAMHYQTWPASTPLETMRDWVRSIRRQSPKARKGTLARDAQHYLASVKNLVSYRDRERIVGLWVAEFGHRSLLSVRGHEIDAVLARWLTEGKAKATVRQWRAVLAHIYSTLYPDWPSPLRSVTAPRPPRPGPRGVPYQIIEAIIAAMPDRGRAAKGEKRRHKASETKARLRVEAYTGLPHSQLAKLRRSDVDWLSATLLFPERGKGRGVQGRRLPLLPQAIEALREYDRLNLWGKTFSASSVGASWLRAQKKVRAELAKDGIALPHIRVYDIRHSFGTLAYEVTGDIRAVGDMLQHSTLALTQRYTLAAVDVRMQAAVAKLQERLPGKDAVSAAETAH
jgi:integrase